MLWGSSLFLDIVDEPDYNDMEVIFQNIVDKGIQILVFPRDAAEEVISHGKDLHGNIHCFMT